MTVAKVCADSESPPRSVKLASAAKSGAYEPSVTWAAPATVSSVGRLPAGVLEFVEQFDPAGGDLGVPLLQLRAVALLQRRPQQLADPGQQAVVGAEPNRFDQEIMGDLVGVELGLLGQQPERVGDRGAHLGLVQRTDPLVVRHHHREQEGLLAAAVHVDLLDVRAGGIQRLQLRDRHELALRQLDHVVDPIHVDQPVRCDLGHDVAGLVVALLVDGRGGDLRMPVVAGHQAFGDQPELAARVAACRC